MASDGHIPNASLETVSFAALEQKDPNEINKLATASTSAGFFYLDFEGSKVDKLPEMKRDLLKVMESYFHQPLDVKLQDYKGHSKRGQVFVKKGTFSGVDREKQEESFEHLAIGSYDLKMNVAGALPALFHEAGNLVPEYIAACEHVVRSLSCYGYILNMSESDLQKHHDQSVKSETILALLSYPGRLTHQKHTDLGSLTVLFSDQWGLQVFSPSTSGWEWVEPREEQAVINVGDGLRFISGKKLFSSVHRVVREGRASSEGHRYSIAYLLRPADNTTFLDAEGIEITAKELAESKYNSYAASHAEQDKSSVLMGGMEKTFGVRV
uniref:Fe2OG dioxygenase domain-containing protein n=1 Tax=Bionectria ochroleuca TaxID=29856 RepID=A0A8H7K3W3_BIOOC